MNLKDNDGKELVSHDTMVVLEHMNADMSDEEFRMVESFDVETGELELNWFSWKTIDIAVVMTILANKFPLDIRRVVRDFRLIEQAFELKLQDAGKAVAIIDVLGLDV